MLIDFIEERVNCFAIMILHNEMGSTLFCGYVRAPSRYDLTPHLEADACDGLVAR